MRELYSKAQDEAKAPTLEREVAELRQKLAEVTRACDVLGHQIKKVSQLEVEVANLKHAGSVQLSVHQVALESHWAEIQRLWKEHTMQLEAKDACCEVEKVRVLAEVQADYLFKLLALYDKQ